MQCLCNSTARRRGVVVETLRAKIISNPLMRRCQCAELIFWFFFRFEFHFGHRNNNIRTAHRIRISFHSSRAGRVRGNFIKGGGGAPAAVINEHGSQRSWKLLRGVARGTVAVARRNFAIWLFLNFFFNLRVENACSSSTREPPPGNGFSRRRAGSARVTLRPGAVVLGIDKTNNLSR